jgi:hypothetical protein
MVYVASVALSFALIDLMRPSMHLHFHHLRGGSRPHPGSPNQFRPVSTALLLLSIKSCQFSGFCAAKVILIKRLPAKCLSLDDQTRACG